MHKEKVARREIGTLAVCKTFPHYKKIISPARLEPLEAYYRKPLNFSSLDDVGHGVKVRHEWILWLSPLLIQNKTPNENQEWPRFRSLYDCDPFGYRSNLILFYVALLLQIHCYEFCRTSAVSSLHQVLRNTISTTELKSYAMVIGTYWIVPVILVMMNHSGHPTKLCAILELFCWLAHVHHTR